MPSMSASVEAVLRATEGPPSRYRGRSRESIMAAPWTRQRRGGRPPCSPG